MSVAISGIFPIFLVDPSTGLIVRAFYKSPENIFSEVPDPSGVTDPDFEAYTLKRFGLKEEADAALKKVRAAKISADNGTIRYTVDECRVTGGKVICTGEETYFGQGAYETSMSAYGASLSDNRGGPTNNAKRRYSTKSDCNLSAKCVRPSQCFCL
jgi:hypothetical protein